MNPCLLFCILVMYFIVCMRVFYIMHFTWYNILSTHMLHAILVCVFLIESVCVCMSFFCQCVYTLLSVILCATVCMRACVCLMNFSINIFMMDVWCICMCVCVSVCVGCLITRLLQVTNMNMAFEML